jgi:hypothetical protein
VRLDDHYNVVPSAAERYSVSANHLTYTFFRLRLFDCSQPKSSPEVAFGAYLSSRCSGGLRGPRGQREIGVGNPCD